MTSLNLSKDLHQSPQHATLTKHTTAETIGSQDAIDEFCAPVEQSSSDSGNGEAIEDHLTKSWQSIIELASSESYSEKRTKALVDFLFKIQSRSNLQVNGQTYTVHDEKVWQDLPLFGRQIREVWNAAPEDDGDKELGKRWVNVNEFAAAVLARAHASGKSQPDLSLFALWTIRSALEDTQTPSNASLSAAASWFVHAHESLRDLSKQKKSFAGKIAKPGALAEESDWTGYSDERWKYWAHALSAAHGKSTDATTAQLVEEARATFE